MGTGPAVTRRPCNKPADRVASLPPHRSGSRPEQRADVSFSCSLNGTGSLEPPLDDGAGGVTSPGWSPDADGPLPRKGALDPSPALRLTGTWSESNHPYPSGSRDTEKLHSCPASPVWQYLPQAVGPGIQSQVYELCARSLSKLVGRSSLRPDGAAVPSDYRLTCTPGRLSHY